MGVNKVHTVFNGSKGSILGGLSMTRYERFGFEMLYRGIKM
jgi:hypothetical protein